MTHRPSKQRRAVEIIALGGRPRGQKSAGPARIVVLFNLVAVADSGLAFGRGSDPDQTASSSEIGARPGANHMKLMSEIAMGAAGRALSRALSR
jgi:hypothetical protein